MSVTPQTNIDLVQMAERLKGLDSFVICGHVSPDGDCLGSQLVLYHALRQLGKEVACLLVKPDSIEKGLQFLPGIAAMVPAVDYAGTPDAFISCDVPTIERIGEDAAAIRSRCRYTFTLDHHANDEAVSQMTYVDPDSASTTMLAWELAALLGVERTPEMATCAYTGLVTDTGRFQFQNTNLASFKAAGEMVEAGANPSDVSRHVFQSRSLPSLLLEHRVLSHMHFSGGGAFVTSYLSRADFDETGAVKADAEPLINTLRSLDGVRVACILREEVDSVRGSLRAKDDADVAQFARQFGGGGHKAAAGFTLMEPLDEAIEQIKVRLLEAFGSSDFESGDVSS